MRTGRVAPETQATLDDGRVREHLANERTLLSWIRLGLSSAGFGFVVARFGLFLRELATRGSGATPGRGAEVIGVGLVLLGVLVVAKFMGVDRNLIPGVQAVSDFASLLIIAGAEIVLS